MVDLTESNIANGTEQETENLPPDDCQIKKESTSTNHTSNKQHFNLQKSSSSDPTVFALQQDCGNLKPKQRCLDPQTQHQIQTDKAHHRTPAVKLRRLSFLETHVTELATSRCCVYVTKDCTQMSLHLQQLDSEAPESIRNLTTATMSNSPHMEPSLDVSPPKVDEALVRLKQQKDSNKITSTQLNAEISQHLQSPADSPCSDKGSSVANSEEHSTREDERDDFCSSVLIPSPTFPSSCQVKVQGSLHREVLGSNLDQLELDKADSRQSCLSDHSPPHSPTTGLKPSEPFDLYSLSHTSPITQDPISEQTLPENTSEWQSEEVRPDEASNSPDLLRFSIPSEPSLSAEDMDDGSGAGTYRGDLGIDSPVSFLWQEGSDGEQVNEESRFDMDFRLASREDRHFVCPVTFRKIMSGPAQALVRDIFIFL